MSRPRPIALSASTYRPEWICISDRIARCSGWATDAEGLGALVERLKPLSPCLVVPERRKAAAFILYTLGQPRPAAYLDKLTDTRRLILQCACTIRSGTAIMPELKVLGTKSSRAFGRNDGS
jgi:hypothetical protein